MIADLMMDPFLHSYRRILGILSRKEAKKTKAREGKCVKETKHLLAPQFQPFWGEYGETKRLLAGWHCRQ